MAPSYLQDAVRGSTPRRTDQKSPIPGREAEMKPNHEGGYVFEVDAMTALRRFLILGTEGGTFYASERRATKDALRGLSAALDELGVAAVDEIVGISDAGRAPKNDPAILALAIASAHERDEVRKAAYAAIPKVCRTGTHLFTFLSFAEEFRGWGRGFRRAVANWYLDKPVEKAAYQAVKYRQRDGWTHADVLRLAKPGFVSDKPSPEHNALFRWIVGKDPGGYREKLVPVEAYERAQASESPAETVKLIGEYGGVLPREALKTEHLTDRDVNVALLRAGMPMTAMIRNLGNLTRHGVVGPMEAGETALVVERLLDKDALARARVHPIAILAALMTYQSGHGARGGNTWTPVREIVDALDAAFYLAFGNVEPTGKRTMLALDVSTSMTWNGVAGIPGLTANAASAAMALVTANVESKWMTFAFTSQFRELNLSPRMTLREAMRETHNHSFGGTDCSLPMVYAKERGLEVDTFCVYTDNETYAGRIHPAQALAAYRRATGIDARLVVIGMTATDFSIADPKDPGMLDVVGFDTSAPQVIADFSAGKL